MKVQIALDAMGGDALAIPNLQGACLAIAKADEAQESLKVFLCGQKRALLDSVELAATDSTTKPEYRLNKDLFYAAIDSGTLEIVDCDQIVGMEESPSVAVRTKKNSSMAKCFELVKSGEAHAAISAGNSGAMMAYGVAILKRLPNVKRPAIMCHFPALHGGVTALLDAGANVDSTAQHLEQFALMGKIYIQSVFEKDVVKVALLNIGEEEGKGNELVKEVHEILKQRMPESYVGFVEGRDVLTGKVDVIVCDGFVGNVVLKTAEGVAKTVGTILKEQFSRNPLWGLGAWLAKGGFSAMKSRLDYREYGAAPLIGLQGLGLVAHGSSDAKAIQNAIRMGSLYARQSLVEKMKQGFEALEDTNSVKHPELAEKGGRL